MHSFLVLCSVSSSVPFVNASIYGARSFSPVSHSRNNGVAAHPNSPGGGVPSASGPSSGQGVVGGRTATSPIRSFSPLNRSPGSANLNRPLGSSSSSSSHAAVSPSLKWNDPAGGPIGASRLNNLAGSGNPPPRTGTGGRFIAKPSDDALNTKVGTIKNLVQF